MPDMNLPNYFYGDEAMQFTYFRIPCQLITHPRFKHLSTDSKLLYGMLLDRMTITAREIKTLEGYVLDTTPKSIKIKVGEAQTLRFYNQKQGCIVVKKLDKQTGEPLAGVEFQITYSDGSYLDDDYGHLSSKENNYWGKF